MAKLQLVTEGKLLHMKLMRISILCVQGCQSRDLDFNNNWNTGHIDKRKIQKASMRFSLFAKKI